MHDYMAHLNHSNIQGVQYLSHLRETAATDKVCILRFM